ncbi:MAG: hypothetical protein KA020_03710 [Planctomycetes bacterium]|nr:hypothetical protein [Planctomycetota bacterium]MCC7066645.1 hypothetical protein [Planctomycetota bacterium]
MQTIGPSDHGVAGVNNVGVAAHIAGARPGSARFDENMSSTARRNIANGIWLCQSCGKKVDGDSSTWSVQDLHDLKSKAEARAKSSLGRRVRDGGRLFVEADECTFVHHFRGAYVPLRIVNERRQGISIQDASLRLDGVDYRPAIWPSSLIVGCPWLAPPPLRLDPADAVFGAWWFGSSFGSLGRDLVAGPTSTAELLVVPVGRPEVRTRLTFTYPPNPSSGGGS